MHILIMFFHSSMVGHLGCFHPLAIMSDTVTNISVQLSKSLVSIPLGTYLIAGIAGSYCYLS